MEFNDIFNIPVYVVYPTDKTNEFSVVIFASEEEAKAVVAQYGGKIVEQYIH